MSVEILLDDNAAQILEEKGRKNPLSLSLLRFFQLIEKVNHLLQGERIVVRVVLERKTPRE